MSSIPFFACKLTNFKIWNVKFSFMLYEKYYNNFHSLSLVFLWQNTWGMGFFLHLNFEHFKSVQMTQCNFRAWIYYETYHIKKSFVPYFDFRLVNMYQLFTIKPRERERAHTVPHIMQAMTPGIMQYLNCICNHKPYDIVNRKAKTLVWENNS